MTRLRLRGSHALRRAFPDPSPHSVPDCGCPATPPGPEPWRFGLCPVRSPLLGVSLLFSLPAGTGMFRFPAFAPTTGAGIIADGLPHSDTRGSTAACASPRRFAACCVLPRLLEPRYPPSALAFFSFLRQALLTGGVLVSLSLLSSECQWSLSPPLREDSPRGLLRGGSPVSFPSPFGEGSATGGILYFLVENKGVEPLTPCLQGRCSKPTELIPRSPVQS